MSVTESQPAASKPERHRFQYSLRAMFGLTTGTAAFFALGRMLGYVDAVLVLAAIVVLVGIIEYPRRVHPATGILLTLVAGTLLWANLRTTGWAREFDLRPLDQLDLVTKSMFYRGWPLCPWMFCGWRHMQFDPNGSSLAGGALVLDGVVFAIALFVTRIASELCFQRQAKPAIKTSLNTPQPQNPPPAGLTSGPRVE